MGLVTVVANLNENQWKLTVCMKSDPLKITDDALTYCTPTTFPILPKVKKEPQLFEEDDIIAKVTKPTNWCSPVVPVKKQNGYGET